VIVQNISIDKSFISVDNEINGPKYFISIEYDGGSSTSRKNKYFHPYRTAKITTRMLAIRLNRERPICKNIKRHDICLFGINIYLFKKIKRKPDK
jgi:hypothetical protein